MAFHFIESLFIDQGTDLHPFLQSVAHLQFSGMTGEDGGKILFDAVLDVNTVGTDTSLPCIAELAGRHLDRRLFQICICKNQVGGLSPSSRLSRFTVSAAFRIRVLPTSVDP